MQDNGDILWQKAQELHLENKFDEAEKMYVQLLEQNYKNTGLMATLGSLYVQTERPGLAIHFLETAIDSGFEDADVYTNVALAYVKTGQRDRAKEYFDKSIEKNPTAEALTNYSGMFIESGESKKCSALCERAIEMNPDLPVAHWNNAISLLGDGVWDKGWDEYEYGLQGTTMREDRILLDVPRWNGEKGTVLVYGEQGLGDEIMFASMLPDLMKTNDVVLECHRRLASLFRRSFPQINVYGTREDTEVSWCYNHKIDYRMAIGSLGKFFRRSRESFNGAPFLDAESLPRGDKFRVGISWTGGGAKVGRVQKRSVPLTWWKPILNAPNVEFVSLQYTDSGEELDLVNALGYDIKKMDEYARADDYYATARLVKSCDLVISICTSVVHLAGALGVPCWVMTPKWPAWRYQNTGGMPWYKSVRLYRSPSPDKEAWFSVIERVGFDLEKLTSEKVLKIA